MSSAESADQNDADPIDDQMVVEYLRSHPKFFEAHDELLSELSLSHGSGEATSLLEHQIRLLREESSQARQQLETLIDNARENETLNKKIHALVIKLMDAAGPQSIFEQLEQSLKRDFGAEFVATRVFASPSFAESGDMSQFAPEFAEQFTSLTAAGVPECGELEPGLTTALFGETSGALSAAQMPLAGNNWCGVLVIASSDKQRYQSGMATDFLTYLCDIVALVIDPWVKRQA